METINAVCECKDLSEEEMVIALKRGRFAFMGDWGIFTWVGVLIMLIITGTFWVFCILGWHLGDILNPKYVCNQCGVEVQPKQFRN